jgi:hypothetical protein
MVFKGWAALRVLFFYFFYIFTLFYYYYYYYFIILLIIYILLLYIYSSICPLLRRITLPIIMNICAV